MRFAAPQEEEEEEVRRNLGRQKWTLQGDLERLRYHPFFSSYILFYFLSLSIYLHFFLFVFSSSLSTTSLFSEAQVVRVSVSSGVEIYKMKYEIMVRALWLAKGTGAPISTPPCAYVPIRPGIRRSRCTYVRAHHIHPPRSSFSFLS